MEYFRRGTSSNFKSIYLGSQKHPPRLTLGTFHVKTARAIGM